MEAQHVLFFLIAVAGAALFVYFAWLEQKKRREELAALAHELGWSFDPSHDSLHDEQFAQFEIFSRGHGRSAYNTLEGSIELLGADCSVRMGDFKYKVTSGSGKNRRTTTYRFSYLIVQLPFHGIPALVIRPEGVFDKLAGVFGFDDIDFESVEFSRRFFVKGTNKRFAYDVIDPRMMEFLLHSGSPMVDIEHGACLISDGSSRWPAAKFKSALEWLGDFFQHWPRHVVDDLRRYAASP